MAKQRTNWKRQGSSVSDVSYPSASTDYDDPNTRYGSSQTPESVVKKRNVWATANKVRNVFRKNILATANQLIYNSHTQYDTHLTYDGIVIGEPSSTSKKPKVWRAA